MFASVPTATLRGRAPCASFGDASAPRPRWPSAWSGNDEWSWMPASGAHLGGARRVRFERCALRHLPCSYSLQHPPIPLNPEDLRNLRRPAPVTLPADQRFTIKPGKPPPVRLLDSAWLLQRADALEAASGNSILLCGTIEYRSNIDPQSRVCNGTNTVRPPHGSARD